MAITSGFFNSLDGDRKYNADQINNFFEGLVGHGVFANVDDALAVRSSSGMTVQVGTGKLSDEKGRWMKNDAIYNLTLGASDVTLNRYDAIVAAIDSTTSKRSASFYVKKGTPATNPTRPTATRNGQLSEYILAYVYVGRGVTAITQANITDTRMNDTVCGYVTGLIEQIDFTDAYLQYQASFDEWFSTVKETLATATLIRSYHSTHTTIADGETVIPINISQFNKELDICQVYINGLRLVPGVEYTITSNAEITLTTGVRSGTPISFEVYKSIDGSDAETVVQQVYTLQTIQNATKITDDAGAVKLTVTDPTVNILDAFLELGIGFHTLYCATGVQGVPRKGAYRLFGHRTGETTGYIIGMQSDGSVYTNYYNGGAWRGWKGIYEQTPDLLYQSENGVFPNDNVEITPTKALNECQHGWALIFSGYDDDNKVGRDYYVQTVYIPKRSYKDTRWNGESMTFPLVYSYNSGTDVNSQCTKTFYVYNDRIVSSSFNSAGVSRNMVLRSIHEY